jgi:hypothetical protein
MQCTKVHALFTDFADNTLSREELHALTDHLLGCQACALEWREFEQTLSLVHSLEPQAPPADLLPGIQAKLARRGIFDRVWTLVESLDFSLSIPTAAAIFTIAMLAGFLLQISPQEQPAVVFSPSPSARVAALPHGEIPAPGRPPLAPNSMFAVSHAGRNQGVDPGPLARTALATHAAPGNSAHQLLSPDIHVLIEDIDHDHRIVLFREMLHQNWQLHRISTNLFLVHLPQADLEDFHEILERHHFALVPAAAAEARFGMGKKVLTAAIRFQ